jgi:hypothetical protein
MHSSRRNKVFSELNVPNMGFKISRRNLGRKQGELISVNPMPRNIPDTLWAEVEPIIPHIRHFRDSPDDRTALAGILYVLVTDCIWKKIPAEFGTWQQVYYRFCRWKNAGVFDQVWLRCSHLYDD